MAAPKGNSYWRLRQAHGRKHKIKTPTQLMNGALDYLQYLEDNPFQEAKAFSASGDVVYGEVPKMRAPTLEGLWVHLWITKTTWYNLKERKGFMEVCEYIEQMFYDWKFQGAASGFLNAAIIARDLGLKDQKDITTDNQPIKTIVMEYD